MTIERLSREDARILRPETGNVSGHTCKVLVLDGRLHLADLRRSMSARLGEAPRLRQRPVSLHGFRRPVWVADVDFDLDAHVLSADAPSPTGPIEFRQLVAELVRWPLDRGRPLAPSRGST